MSGKPDHTALCDVARLFGVPLDEAWGQYVESRGFTELHEVLLGIYGAEETLDEYLSRFATERRLAGIIDAPDFSGRSALAWAVAYGWARAAASLVAHGANVNQRTPSGLGELPVLHIALAGPASGEPTCDFLAIVSLLLSAGADPNAVDHEGWTALHIAASWNSYDAITILLRCSRSPVNMSALNYEGKTAAQVAVESGADLIIAFRYSRQSRLTKAIRLKLMLSASIRMQSRMTLGTPEPSRSASGSNTPLSSGPFRSPSNS
ncbi:ankyrin repeat domain-containing protein [Purpureocillium lilacinum]|uniref:Ankyrin repeat domain-containing protein n=1 Tax=Purpureocillium lilacinum TaxID=33203 RepID=A0A179EXN8_PURLI|nr:ankyrin repeat domain-containing protein [Purpureocillium lilacinum]OAQ57938.1 ankyrin repeat domain-containing protein [Purpureocillium lilacinum]